MGGYAFWTKRRLQPATDRYAVLVLLSEGEPPTLYCIPTLDWLTPSHALTDRDYAGQASEPEWGVEVNGAALGGLGRYAWTSKTDELLSR